MTKNRKKTLPTLVAAWALVALVGVPAYAGKPAKSTGDINPTSVALVDSDFQLSASTAVALLDDPVVAKQIQAEAANAVAAGRGVLVAVLDTGFTSYSEALDARMSPMGYDFVDGDPDPYDSYNADEFDDDDTVSRARGHGTMVAAMVLNAAPEATILPLRIRDEDGHGTDGPVVDAIYYALKVGADVINLSISQDILDGTGIGLAIKEARDCGVVVVASAGNDGSPFIPFEAVGAAHLVVAAVDQDDVIAPFSNYVKWRLYNRARMVFAPGVEVQGPLLVDGKPSRCTWSGTSFSAGLVSGAVALAIELHPAMDVSDVVKLVSLAGDEVRLPKGGPEIAGLRINLQKLVSQ